MSPIYREYERASTTTLNAYLMPVVGAYIRRVQQGLSARKFKRKLFIMQSNGGVATPDIVERFPIRIIESGPAAGVITAVRYAGGRRHRQHPLVRHGRHDGQAVPDRGRPPVADRPVRGGHGPSKKNSGLPINIPAIDLVEIGSGGGSIARVEMGAIAVGPESASSEPGPDLLRPRRHAADGHRRRSRARLPQRRLFPRRHDASRCRGARRGIDDARRRPLGLTGVAAAWGIHEVVTAKMAQAARVVSVSKGKDPRDFVLIPFGGAGPVHGARLARMLGCERIVFPHGAGVESAIGLLMAEPAFDLARTRITRSTRRRSRDQRDLSRPRDRGQGAARGLRHHARARATRAAPTCAFAGQGYEICRGPARRTLSRDRHRAAARSILRRLAAAYGDRAFDRDEPVELVHFRLTAAAR